MPSDYRAIAEKHVREYGTKVAAYGEVLLAHLYADRTHFLYELMQNAEDALGEARSYRKASFDSTLRFHLHQDHLEVSHFGRPFSGEDVRAICALVESTKREELTAIGKFGIGFKSVYAFTRHPEVHSADEHFVIDTFVRPRAAKPLAIDDHETRFLLPFDHPQLGAGAAFQELASRFPSLGLRTLLFLHHIEAIEWSIAGGGEGSYRRRERSVSEAAREVRLEADVDGKTSDKRGLVRLGARCEYVGHTGPHLAEGVLGVQDRRVWCGDANRPRGALPSFRVL